MWGLIKMYQYLISDLDHTLLQENGQLDPLTVDEIRQSPLQISLASARNPYSMIDFIQQLQLTGPQLAMNGGLIFRYVDQQIHILEKRFIAKSLALQVQTAMKQRYPQIDFTWITEDTWFIPRMTSIMQAEMQYSGVQPVLGKHLQETASPIQIVLVMKDPRLFQRVQQFLQESFGKQLAIRASGDGYLTLNAAGASKATIVDYLMQHGAPREEIVAVGDDENDVPLLLAAGHSLTVANAHPQIKALVDEVIASNVNDGVANFLQQLAG